MNHPNPALLALLLVILTRPLHAQVVADGATATLANVPNSFTGDVTVGTNGSFTLLVLSDNVLLTNSANGIIGRTATAKSNEVRLTSATARWRMGGSLFVGSNGGSSRLVVSQGAVLEDFNGNLGFASASSNNSALITGFGSLWTNSSDLFIGGSGSYNRLVISNGADVFNARGMVGSVISSVSNLVLFTDSGSLWVNTGGLTVGESGSGNSVVVSNGAVLSSAGETVIGRNNSASGNSISVTGTGAFTGFGLQTFVGREGSFNRVIASDGAQISGAFCYVGFSGDSNELIHDPSARLANLDAARKNFVEYGRRLETMVKGITANLATSRKAS